ncbi:MAG: EscU/YscU/HrcU family type III secretion system export apparatus switch protein [Myxococcaceae bacterium]
MTEKRFPATPARRLKARKKGQFARSTLANTAGAAVGVVAGLLWVLATQTQGPLQWIRDAWQSPAASVDSAVGHAMDTWLRWVMPPTALGAAGALGVAGFCAARPWVATPVRVDADRISPGRGFKRLMSPAALAGPVKGTLLLSGFAALIAWTLAPSFLAVSSAAGAGGLLARFAVSGLVLLIVTGVADFVFERWRTEKQIRMSREELKQELKDAESNPEVKAQRRAMHRQLMLGGPARGVAHANVVVVNPTHLAVALRYEGRESETPYVVARGLETDAAWIRAEASRLGIPVVRDVPLARSLIHLEVGEAIPEELYQAAAAVLQFAADAHAPGGVS